jgi:hemolysin activation/secretion protein
MPSGPEWKVFVSQALSELSRELCLVTGRSTFRGYPSGDILRESGTHLSVDLVLECSN